MGWFKVSKRRLFLGLNFDQIYGDFDDLEAFQIPLEIFYTVFVWWMEEFTILELPKLLKEFRENWVNVPKVTYFYYFAWFRVYSTIHPWQKQQPRSPEQMVETGIRKSSPKSI